MIIFKKILFVGFFVLALTVSMSSEVSAGIFNFGKNVEADPSKEYRLSELNGPTMILVTTFTGANGRRDANTLVYELRKNYKYKAYIYEQTFVHDLKKEEKQPQNPYARPWKYQKTGSQSAFAVLVGDFQSFDDLDFQKTLKEIKQSYPECMKVNQPTSQNYKIWRNNSAAVNGKGPLYMAFGVINPMLPPENQQGTIDKLVEALNANSPYSLLKCQRRYTVRIATFTGKIIIRQDEIKEIESGKKPFSSSKTSQLEIAGKAATKLCQVLREKGVEAYEFHDRFASFVTIGGFDSYGQELPNGMIELHPEIAQIMEQFQGKPATQGVQPGTIAHEPVKIAGIECDVQPMIIEIPRKGRSLSQR
ncbi:MAG: hypothetical protein LBP87_00720 [Planctomycetaceae bacterium]|jgi:hypothetical protein|nr:hypothetical protein [Planctomycetaceae bacterium]